MMNVYNGSVVLDDRGAAVVALPDWFEALNRNFRYQLTPVGAPSPDLHIAAEIEGNQFTIAGGKGGVKVSWQVTGVRKDAYAEANRIKVEERQAPARARHLSQSYGVQTARTRGPGEDAAQGREVAASRPP